MAVDTLQFEESRLLDVARFAKRIRVSSYVWHTGLIGILAMLPSLLLSVNPMAGAYGTVAALVMLLFIALQDDKCRKLALSASILPLAMLVMAVYPYNPNPFYRTWVEYDVILLLAIKYSYLFKEKQAKKYRIKVKQLPQVLPIFIVIGGILGAVGFGLLRYQYGFNGNALMLVLPVTAVFAITEELLFRGLIQRQAMKLTSKLFAVVLTVAIYAAASIGLGSTLPLAFGVIAAAALGAIYNYTQNLVLTTVTNIAMKLTYIGLVAAFVLR